MTLQPSSAVCSVLFSLLSYLPWRLPLYVVTLLHPSSRPKLHPHGRKFCHRPSRHQSFVIAPFLRSVQNNTLAACNSPTLQKSLWKYFSGGKKFCNWRVPGVVGMRLPSAKLLTVLQFPTSLNSLLSPSLSTVSPLTSPSSTRDAI